MPPQNRLDDLTAREREVLDLVRLGLTNEEIAGRLGITEAGAKYHVSQILSKLGVTTREEAAAVDVQPPHVAEAFQPRRPRWWAAFPLAAKAAGVAVMLAAVAGLVVLAWGVLRTSGDTDYRDDLVDDTVSTFRPTLKVYGTVVEIDYNDRTMKIRASDPSQGEFDARLTDQSLIEVRGEFSPDELRPQAGETVLATLRSPGPQYEIERLIVSPEVFTVEGAGMSPSLYNGIEVEVVPYVAGLPQRGDIVVFTSPTTNVNRSFVKRVIGMPGDDVEIVNGQLKVNGSPLEEPYAVGANECMASWCRWEIPDADTPQSQQACRSARCYFVLGDNRQNSSDSRQGWLVPLENIQGWVQAPSPTP